MRARLNPVEALVGLPRLVDAAERRASWRQAITALGQDVRVKGPPPLEGAEPDALARAAQVALEGGLADDLDWIAPGAAAVALYELSAALPAGSERREIGRRVFARLYEGTASTFAAVATRMALGSGKPLETATLRARIGLIFDMPVGSGVDADALALTLISRRELLERWVVRPSTGALPARRLAAKLLEHAAREAVMRAQQGDPHARDLFMSEDVRPAFQRLLADREPLVWRHAAVARGLLAAVASRLREEIEVGLDPALTPTEWRRAAVSLVASMVGDPELAPKSCRALLNGEIAGKDPGIAATMVWGLPPVIEAEPDLAEELLDRLSTTRRPDVAEATASLLADTLQTTFGMRAAGTLRAVLASRAESESPAQRAITERALRVLDREHVDDESVQERVRRALVAYEATGARAAHELALDAAAAAHKSLDRIVARDPLDENTLPEELALLADLDSSALERSRLADLLLLGRRPGDNDSNVLEMEQIYERISGWILEGEERAIDAPWSRSGSLAQRRLLVALLHLVDLETARGDADQSGTGVRMRVRRTIQVLGRYLAAGPDASVHRVLCATLARSFDAAVREGVAEPSDLLLLVAQLIADRHSIATISEASTQPDVSSSIAAYAKFLGASPSPRMESRSEITSDTASAMAVVGSEDEAAVARRVIRLSRGLGAGGSYRSEALRQVVLRLGRALEVVASARGLNELTGSAAAGEEPLDELERATSELRRLCSGALRRLMDDTSADITVVADVAPLSLLTGRAVSVGVPANAQQFGMATSELVADLPEGLSVAIKRVVRRLEELPATAASDVYAIPLGKRRTALPDWLLPRRTIGAFYVVRALGSGGVSSVFIARRMEERHDSKAESFALKVPEFDPATARSLSEREFLQMFREEAGALLSLPQHPNLARFVTFDMAARPKPILVMELIPGQALDRLVRSRSLTTERALHYLDGILAGLEAMHGVGVGHLDVKPSNVILRDGETPVLVDFGLSGRQLRPGCGTLEFCAPEVLGVVPEGATPSPLAADMYAFACTAYEVLTADPLFEADDETSLISAQVSHDGWPPKLAELGRSREFAELGIVLAACMRRDPRDRPTAAETRAALKGAAAGLQGMSWPLRLPAAAASA